MPIYEYRCQSCEHKLDAIQKIADAPLTDCPACGQPDLRRLVSAPSFRLKGGGWYETDFKKDKRRNLADSGEGKSAESSDKSDGAAKSDSKSGGESKSKTPEGGAGKSKEAAA